MLYDNTVDPQFMKYEVVRLIKEGRIANLLDVDWCRYTHNWGHDDILYIMENVAPALKARVVEAMLLSYRIWLNDGIVIGGGKTLAFLEQLKEHVSRYDSFNKALEEPGKAVQEMRKENLSNVADGFSKGMELPKLPDELNSDKAKNMLQEAINMGLCDDNYKWEKTKALLAYFGDMASEHLGLGKGEYDGNAKTSWKPFERLFGVSGLSGAKRDYKKTGTLPEGYKVVNSLFEKLQI